ncbi:MAG: hypothetical protein AAF415_02360 [Pseudomonadota bacterium]
MTDASRTAGRSPVSRITADERKFFAQCWGSFLRANFRDYFDVAQSFYVEPETARRWWNGEGGAPNGLVVGMAFGMKPDQAREHLVLVVDNSDADRAVSPVLRQVAS